MLFPKLLISSAPLHFIAICGWKVNASLLTGSWFRNGVKLSRSESIVIRVVGETHTLIAKNLTVDDNNAEFSFSADGCQSSAVVTVKGKLVRCTNRHVALIAISNFDFFIIDVGPIPTTGAQPNSLGTT